MLRITSCQAPNADPLCRDLAAYLAEGLGTPVHFVEDMEWPQRYRALETGELDLAWICGLPYIRLAALTEPAVHLLAAPVMAGVRYGDRAQYFSDVVVRADSTFTHFTDLAGTRWAYNEPGSQSGYGVVAYHLAASGLTWQYFGQVIASGSHQRSLALILAGEIDASAIDSTVLETELRLQPGLARRLRVIERLGPSPMPPWVASTRLPASLRARLQNLFTDMHRHERGRAILAASEVARFAAVSDRDYDPIRQMAMAAARLLPPANNSL